jgi:ribosomal protein S18 acetylase RimI-like enzyme
MMRIREVVPEDRKDLLKILEATGVFQDYEIQVADEVLRDSMTPASGYHSRCCVNEEGRVVGYVCWGPTPCTSGTYDLYWIAVHPDFQGHGVGKLLLHYAEEHAQQEKARLIIIETSSLNDYDGTRRFYSKNGYQQYAIIPDFYRQGDHKIIYGKSFVS